MPNYNCLEIPKVLIYQQDLNDPAMDLWIDDLFSDLAKQLKFNSVLSQYLQLKNTDRRQQRQLNIVLLDQLLKLIKREDLWQYFTLNQHNRPCFLTPHLATKIDFNISHSSHKNINDFSQNLQKVTAVAIGLDWVGLDLEIKHQAKRNYLALAKRFSSPKELDFLQHSNNLEHDFFYLWTLREAVLKTKGFGVDRLRSLEHDFTQINCKFAPDNGLLVFNSELNFYLSLALPKQNFPKIEQNRWQYFNFSPKNKDNKINLIENLHFKTLNLN